MSYLELMGFGPNGWGSAMLTAAGVTLAVALCAFLIGGFIGVLGAWAKLSNSIPARLLAGSYTTVLRGVPDLMVLYLFYFGGGMALSRIADWFGASGSAGLPAFATGAAAVGLVSGAYQTEVFRGAYLALNRGEIEAARSVGMHRLLRLRRIVALQAMRYALPGLGNVWQLVLKESALISVTGLVELLRQSAIGAGSTRQPFAFYATAAALYLAITTVSTWGFQRAEAYASRGVRRA
jgi:octopine/nopaline transport system permease protein